MGCCTPTPSKQTVKKQTKKTDPNPFASLKTGINIPVNHQSETNPINHYSNQKNTASQLKKTPVPSISMRKIGQKDPREIVETNASSSKQINQNGQVSTRIPQKIEQDYPDMDNYGNAQTFYQKAAGKQADNVLRDEDFGYYAANGRNVSLKVDLDR